MHGFNTFIFPVPHSGPYLANGGSFPSRYHTRGLIWRPPHLGPGSLGAASHPTVLPSLIAPLPHDRIEQFAPFGQLSRGGPANPRSEKPSTLLRQHVYLEGVGKLFFVDAYHGNATVV